MRAKFKTENLTRVHFGFFNSEYNILEYDSLANRRTRIVKNLSYPSENSRKLDAAFQRKQVYCGHSVLFNFALVYYSITAWRSRREPNGGALRYSGVRIPCGCADNSMNPETASSGSIWNSRGPLLGLLFRRFLSAVSWYLEHVRLLRSAPFEYRLIDIAYRAYTDKPLFSAHPWLSRYTWFLFKRKINHVCWGDEQSRKYKSKFQINVC